MSPRGGGLPPPEHLRRAARLRQYLTDGGMFGSRRRETAGFRSRRSMVIACGGMACTSQPLATAAAIDILRRGGNAVDAAVAAAAVLGVVEPYMTGLGGDCFMLVWDAAAQRLLALNGSGRAPAALTPALVRDRGHAAMPADGALSVTIPGAVDAWAAALARCGTRPLAGVLEAAIDYARHGYPVSEIVAHEWQLLLDFNVLRDPEARRTFSLDGRAPRPGEVFRIPALATTLEAVAAGGADAFYRGPLAARLVAALREHGGVHTPEDFAAHTSAWVEPVAAAYRDCQLYELPPNSQGLTALLALNILENFDVGALPVDSPDVAHLQIEAVKLALADRDRYLGDPAHAAVPVDELLSKDYAQGRAALIDRRRARKDARPGRFAARGDTVCVTTADRTGTVVSLINSLFGPFGSGLVAGDTGVVLHNRGAGFVLEPGHPNCLAPGKRPLHTLMPGMLCRDGRPLVAFGVMGGDFQAQAHLQVVSRLVDHGLNIQEALDFPRFRFLDSDRVAVEPDYGPAVLAELAARGHDVVDPFVALAAGGFGGGQGILIDPLTGCFRGGSDWRKDGCAMGF